MGTELILGQMEVQEQVLQYQYVRFVVLALSSKMIHCFFLDVRRMYG